MAPPQGSPQKTARRQSTRVKEPVNYRQLADIQPASPPVQAAAPSQATDAAVQRVDPQDQAATSSRHKACKAVKVSFSKKTVKDLRDFMWRSYKRRRCTKDINSDASKEWKEEFVATHPDITRTQLNQAIINNKRRWLKAKIERMQQGEGEEEEEEDNVMEEEEEMEVVEEEHRMEEEKEEEEVVPVRTEEKPQKMCMRMAFQYLCKIADLKFKNPDADPASILRCQNL